MIAIAPLRGGGTNMRFLVKVTLPVETANAAAKKDGLAAIRSILEEQKPEAAYFIVDRGKRTAVLILNMDKESDIPRIAEPWFLAFNAEIEATPAMVAEDLADAGPAIASAVEKYG